MSEMQLLEPLTKEVDGQLVGIPGAEWNLTADEADCALGSNSGHNRIQYFIRVLVSCQNEHTQAVVDELVSVEKQI